ncbi:MAG: flavodoxin [Actinomycetes bacterium]
MIDDTHALVVYESELGRTRSVAEAVADALQCDGAGTVVCTPLRAATPHAVERTGLLVVGLPTRVQHADDDRVDLSGPDRLSRTARAWLDAVPPGFGRATAVFDTRPDVHVAGAADAAATRLLREGYALVCPPQVFLVSGPVGPLPPEEWLRARTWAAARLPLVSIPGGLP